MVGCGGGGASGSSSAILNAFPGQTPTATPSGKASPTPRPSTSPTPHRSATPDPSATPTPHRTASPTPTPRPSPTSTPVPPGTYHIATWVNDAYWAEGSVASSAQVAQLVSYAQSGLGNTKALDDCSAHPGTCKSVFYFNPNRVFSGNCPSAILSAASESWFVHWPGYTDTAHRVYYRTTVGCKGGSDVVSVWSANDGTTGVQGWWRSDLQTNADGYDMLFMDNTHAETVYQYSACLPYPSLCTTTQEVPNDAMVQAAHASFVNSINHKNGRAMQFAFNSMDVYGAGVSHDVPLFNASSRFVAGICEGCAVTNGTLVPISYSGILNTMAARNASHGSFVLHSTYRAPTGSSTQISERIVTTGLVWLGYSEGHTVIWADLEDASKNLSVWPEDLIYPSHPVQSMGSGASDLQVASGIWRREFTTCYQAGDFFGRCAAIVNSTTSAVTVPSSWLSQTYTHTITVAGGDALSGGTAKVASRTFVPNSTTVPGSGALLLAQ